MADGNAWLADFEARVDAAKEKAAKFQESLNSAGASASSKDGLITVTVAPNGSLADLRINDAALHGSGARLAQEILHTAREAQRKAAGNVLMAFTEMGGKDSEVTKMLTGFMPPPEPDAPPESARFLPPVDPPADPSSPAARPAGPPQQVPPPLMPPPAGPEPSVHPERFGQQEPPPHRPRPTVRQDDDDTGDGSVFGSTDW